MTEGKGKEGAGERTKSLSKFSVLERKQDFIKILAEYQPVPISSRWVRVFHLPWAVFLSLGFTWLFSKHEGFGNQS